MNKANVDKNVKDSLNLHPRIMKALHKCITLTLLYRLYTIVLLYRRNAQDQLYTNTLCQ